MAREASKKRKASKIGLLRSGDNVADALTKRMNQVLLLTCVCNGMINSKTVQWIIRDYVFRISIFLCLGFSVRDRFNTV